MPENPYLRAAKTPANKLRLRLQVAKIRQKRGPKPPRPPQGAGGEKAGAPS